MERGTLRMHKALSRSLLVRRAALEFFENYRAGKVGLKEAVQVGGADEAAKD
jgi:hypothetical protein